MAKKSSTHDRKRTRKSYRNKHRLPPPPPPTHSSKLWIWALVIFVSIQQVLSAGLLRHDFNGANSTGGTSRMAAARFRRDTIKLDNAITNLGHLARIANGIALEIGLVDGTIDPGEAVAELLHMGPLTVDDITNLSKETIDGVLNALGDKASAEKAVLDLENRLVLLENMRAITPKFQDVGRILKEYTDSLEKVKELVNLKDGLDGLVESLNKIEKPFEFIEKMVDKETLSQEEVDEAGAGMFYGFRVAQKLESSESFLNNLTDKVTEAKKIHGKSSFIDTLVAENDLRKQLVDTVGYDASIEPLLENFKKVIEDSETAFTANKNFQSIRTLVQTRGPHHRQSYKHCSGLPNGADDLDELYVSSANPFFVKHISNGETVSKNLRQTFEPFKMLEKLLDDVTKNWEPLKKPSELNIVFLEVSKFAAISGKSKSVSDIVKSLRECDKASSSRPNTNVDKLVSLKSPMQLLDDKIDKISNFDYVNQFQSFGEMKAAFDTNSKTGEEKNNLVKSTLAKWRTDKSLKDFVNNVYRLRTDISPLLSLLNNKTDDIDLTTVNAHLSTVKTKEYQKFLSCLGEIKTAGTPVKDLIDYISKSKQTVVSPGAKSAIANVIDSGKSLEKAKSAATDFKSNKALPPQLANLKSSFDKDGYKEISEKLGMGVQGLLTIKRVREVKIVAKDVNDILKDATANGLSPEHQKSLEQLKEIPKVLDSIETFLKSSQGLQVFRRKRDTGFQDFHQIFTDAQGIQGATVDMESIREAMEELNKKTNQKHATSMTQLKNWKHRILILPNSVSKMSPIL